MDRDSGEIAGKRGPGRRQGADPRAGEVPRNAATKTVATRDERPMTNDQRTVPTLRMVFWETTKACNLTCRHCRAVPQRCLGPTDLTTSEALDLIDGIAAVAKPVLVLSGGEPLYRPDLFDIAEYGVQTGFRMALATNGMRVTE